MLHNLEQHLKMMQVCMFRYRTFKETIVYIIVRDRRSDTSNEITILPTTSTRGEYYHSV
jgi:hypothetical protein